MRIRVRRNKTREVQYMRHAYDAKVSGRTNMASKPNGEAKRTQTFE